MKECLIAIGVIAVLSLIIIFASVSLIISVIFLIRQLWGMGFLILLVSVFFSVIGYGIFEWLNNFLGLKI